MRYVSVSYSAKIALNKRFSSEEYNLTCRRQTWHIAVGLENLAEIPDNVESGLRRRHATREIAEPLVKGSYREHHRFAERRPHDL
jgi:hypothetical protein